MRAGILQRVHARYGIVARRDLALKKRMFLMEVNSLPRILLISWRVGNVSPRRETPAAILRLTGASDCDLRH